jgi:diadenosine tetraphosphate (Ap4A) HIT family hydrolase
VTAFTLDARLAADTVPVAALALCEVRLLDDRRFPWAVLVPRCAGRVEIVDLDAADRARLIEEIAQVSAAMRLTFAPDKLNVGALGNVVPQLHVHVIARYRTDAAWPGPAWGTGREPYDDPSRARVVVDGLRAGLKAPRDAGLSR